MAATRSATKIISKVGHCHFCDRDDVEVSAKARKGYHGWVVAGVSACAKCIEHEAKIRVFDRLTFTAGQ